MLTVSSFLYCQVLWRQFLKFKETELPAKEADKNRSKNIYKSFEVNFFTARINLMVSWFGTVVVQ